MTDRKKLYVQYGAGFSGPQEWLNFDASPTLQVQMIPVVGKALAKFKNGSVFPDTIKFGDIVKGLPIESRSVDGLYASHILEHLSLQDCRVALRNSLEVLRPGGVFRLIVPDLASRARNYLARAELSDPQASHMFMRETYLGKESATRGVKGIVVGAFGNSDHLWMWDYHSMAKELMDVGFVDIREASLGDSGDPMFDLVERADRFIDNGIVEVAIEARRPV